MQIKTGFGAALVVLAGTALMPSAAQADYFVRPYISLGGEVIDGLEEDGATSASLNFTNDLQANVDLASGTVSNYLRLTGPDSGGSATGQTAGIMGDTLTFYEAEGTEITFSFAFDGQIRAPAHVPGFENQQVGIFANLYVFDAAAGANWSNFTSLEGALVAESMFLNFVNPEEDLDEYINELMSGTVTVAGISSFEVFAGLSMFAALNNNPVTVELDFLSTGTFGIQAAPGVTYTSDSGVFLTAQSPAVPEPASWAMMLTGFGAVGYAIRRRPTARMQAV